VAGNMPALESYIEKQFGGRFTEQRDVKSVGTTPTLLAPNDYERMGLTVVNLGSSVVTLDPFSGMVDGQGILLLTSGSFMTLTARDDLSLVGSAWYATVSTGTENVYVLQVKRFAAIQQS